jgi:hypothetical protein
MRKASSILLLVFVMLSGSLLLSQSKALVAPATAAEKTQGASQPHTECSEAGRALRRVGRKTQRPANCTAQHQDQAQCRDGSYTTSQRRRACAHHGGVGLWIIN